LILKLIILITSRTAHTLDLGNAWQRAGASGVTVLEGYGLRRLQEKVGIRDDLPLIPSLSALLRQQEESSFLLLALVSDEAVKPIYDATIGLLGDLTLPDNGVIFTMDVGDVLGIRVNKGD
jgi:nitrogen regulatory protein P-II 1